MTAREGDYKRETKKFSSFTAQTMVIISDEYCLKNEDIKLIKKRFGNFHQIDLNKKDEDEVIGKIKRLANKNQISMIVINSNGSIKPKTKRFLKELEHNEHINVVPFEQFFERYLHKCYIPDSAANSDLIKNIKPYSKWQYFQKRLIDYFGVFCIFLFSWPIMLYSAYRIKKVSPDGPILFRQKRVGRDGKEFVCVKFRSMYEDDTYFNYYTQKDDPRIFPYGKLMRKKRYDELPQLINVFKGEMHLIGPRAEWNELVKRYEKEIPYYNKRHLVAPGITGWAQVMYRYGASIDDARQKLMYDLYYIKHWNIGLELKIVLMTAMTVINANGR